jgi:hypothetical protein
MFLYSSTNNPFETIRMRWERVKGNFHLLRLYTLHIVRKVYEGKILIKKSLSAALSKIFPLSKHFLSLTGKIICFSLVLPNEHFLQHPWRHQLPIGSFSPSKCNFFLIFSNKLVDRCDIFHTHRLSRIAQFCSVSHFVRVGLKSLTKKCGNKFPSEELKQKKIDWK